MGRHATAGQADKTVMGASCTGPYEVTSPGRSRASGTTRQADRSRQGQVKATD